MTAGALLIGTVELVVASDVLLEAAGGAGLELRQGGWEQWADASQRAHSALEALEREAASVIPLINSLLINSLTH